MRKKNADKVNSGQTDHQKKYELTMNRMKLCLVMALFISAAPAFAQSRTKDSRSSQEARLTGNNEEVASSSPLINFLPFGAGQFYNERPVLGTFFASTELMSAVVWLRMHRDLNNAKLQHAALPGCDQNGKIDPACVGYERSFQDYKNGVENLRNKAMISFGLLYALGVIQAVMDTPPSLMASTNDELDRDYQLRPGQQEVAATRRASEQSSSVRWGMGISPATAASMHERVGLALTLHFSWL